MTRYIIVDADQVAGVVQFADKTKNKTEKPDVLTIYRSFQLLGL